MDPRNWVDQLYTYGPYAVLALFVLWVAPAQLKAFRQVPNTNRPKQLVSGFIAIGCWLIVFSMVGYIYFFWPPRTVYLGTFGIHNENAKFYSQTPELFISSRRSDGSRLKWDYVIVTDTASSNATNSFDFAFQWGGRVEDAADYSLPRSLLQKRRIDFYSDRSRPEILLYDDDSNPDSPLRPYPRIVSAAPAATAPVTLAAIISSAQAQGLAVVDRATLMRWLSSSDGNLRAQARAQLRQMSPADLQQLLQAPGLSSDARDQINAERGRRR